MTNKRNIEILTAHLKRRFDNEPIDLVYYLYAIIYKQYNETPETNETEKMRLAEQVEAYMNYFNNR